MGGFKAHPAPRNRLITPLLAFTQHNLRDRAVAEEHEDEGSKELGERLAHEATESRPSEPGVEGFADDKVVGGLGSVDGCAVFGEGGCVGGGGGFNGVAAFVVEGEVGG